MYYYYIPSQKLSPTFLCVSKLDVKLGSGGMIFKITICTWFLKIHTKSKVFQKYRRQRAFFSKFDVKLGSRVWFLKEASVARTVRNLMSSWGVAVWFSKQASLARAVPKPFPTKSLRLPPGSSSAFTRRARSASFVDNLLTYDYKLDRNPCLP